MADRRTTTDPCREAIGAALKPILRRLAALERDSHAPLDLAPFVQELVSAALAGKALALPEPLSKADLDRAVSDLRAKQLSLRAISRRLGVGVGRVRGSIARIAAAAQLRGLSGEGGGQ